MKTKNKTIALPYRMSVCPNSSIWTATPLFRLFLACALICSLPFGEGWGGASFAQNIGINTAGATPHASAILDIDVAPGNDKGWLIPRITTTQRNAIASPAHSLLIFNTTTDCFEAWNQNTLTWVAFGCIGCQLPGAFSSSAASGIAGTSFSANWSASGGATAYFLDVSAVSNFASFVAGYNNLNVGNVVSSSVTGLTCGTYYYRIRANNTCGTSANSETITVTTNPSVVPSQPSVITGTTPVCQGNNGVVYSVSNLAGVTYTWSYSGTGYTQATGGTTNSITANFSGAATSGTLTVTPSNACGNGTAQTLAITVSVTPTIANAGADQTICATTATLAGNTPTTGTGLWTLVSGAGTITTPSSPTSGLTALGVGANTFRWTISNAPCTASTDDVIITRSDIPTTASANTDQTICSTTGTLAGNTPTVGTGLWTLVSGTGTITTPTSPISGLTALGVGANTFRWTISNSPCSASIDDVIITRSDVPTLANAGANISRACELTTATLAGNTATVGTGVWSVVSGTATITTPSSPISGVTGLVVPGTATLRWTISNAPCTASTDDVIITTGTLAITHTIGTIAPETKSVNYGTVTTSLSGASKCWITQNLGSTNQASSATDNTAAAAGWYWQFNRKQGYKDGPTPAWTITAINEASNWLPANDPCTIELGAGWRIPTNTEWTNADVNGAWANYTNTYSSVLKLHAAGYLISSTGALFFRGTAGYYWSSPQFSNTNGWYLIINISASNMSSALTKAYGFSVRCLRDCATPTTANAGSDINPACGVTTATLAGNTATVGTGAWSVVSGTATITTPSSPTSGVTGLAVPGTATLRWTISNAPCTASTDDVVITTTCCGGLLVNITPANRIISLCGQASTTITANGSGGIPSYTYLWNNINPSQSILVGSGTYTVKLSDASGCPPVYDTVTVTSSTLAINHTIGTVAPETKSVNYGTVATSLSGASKCWITQNLGSTNQASSATDGTDASAGWYWQFNRKQGYKVGPTPAWTITAINEASDWLAANDPCTIELGAGWRIPTNTEWTNADVIGAWNNYTDAYNSVLKLHAAGYLNAPAGTLVNRGVTGNYRSSVQDSSTSGWVMGFDSGVSLMFSFNKASGFSLRCLRD